MRRSVRIGIIAAVVSVVTGLIFGTRQNIERGEPAFQAMGPFTSREIPATQRIRYFVTTVKSWGPGRLRKEASTRLRNLLRRHRQGGFRIFRKGHAEGTRRVSLSRAMRRWRHLIEDVGQHVTVYAKAMSDDFRVRTSRWDIDPAKWADTMGSPSVDIIVGTVLSRHPSLRVVGIYSCRLTVYGGWSQHAYSHRPDWQGNAVDVAGSSSAMNAAAHDIFDLTKEGWVPASQIIWQGREMFSGHSIYDHFNHVHFSGAPLNNGSPCG